MGLGLDEICEEIDRLTLRNLDLMEEKINLHIEMESQIRNGHIDLAKTRYINGKERVCISQVPSHETDIVSLFALEQKSINDLPSFDISLKSNNKDTNEEEKNPIKWFGVLVPQNLKTAQKSFQETVYCSVRTANVQVELDHTLKELSSLYILKHTISKEESDV